MQFMIAISSEKREVYERLIGEVSRFRQKVKPKFFVDDENSTFKYCTIIIATPEEAKLIKEKLDTIKKELDEVWN